MARSSDDSEMTQLDRMTATEWMDAHGWTSGRLRWLIAYACRDDYGCLPEDTSAWAAAFYFASRVRQSGRAPQSIVTWPEGNGRLVLHLADAARGHIRERSLAASVVPGRDAVEVVVSCPEGRRRIRAQQVVFAAPRFVARYVIRDFRDHPPAYLDEFQYGAWMVANLALRDRPLERGFPLAWDNVGYESPSLGYVCATHQLDIDRGPTVFTYYFPLCDSNPKIARERLLSTTRDEWAEVALADLSRAHVDIDSLVTEIDVIRWGHAMIRPRPGFLWGEARRKATASYRGIYFAHTDMSGMALFEEALWHGVRAAEEVMKVRGIPCKSFLE
jgi:hypothetical protein